MNGDRHVGRQGPRRRRPDHRVPVVIARPIRAGPARRHARNHGEIDVDARRGLLVVLQLRLGERRAVRHAPVDRLELAEDVALVEQVGQDVEDPGLVPGVEGEVGLVPIAEHAQAAELLTLDVHPLHRLGMAEGPDLGLAHRGRLRAQLLDDLVLDGQAVTVPARHVGAVKPPHRQRADDEILEHLVHGRPHVDLAVGIGRSIMEHLPRGTLARLSDLLRTGPDRASGPGSGARERSSSPSSRTGSRGG